MAESDKCQKCGKPATVHLTQIVNGKTFKLHLCDQCAEAHGVTDPTGFSLGAKLGEDVFAVIHMTPAKSDPVLACPHCGMTLARFREQGRLGCAHCYEALGDALVRIFPHLDLSIIHGGRCPAGFEPGPAPAAPAQPEGRETKPSASVGSAPGTPAQPAESVAEFVADSLSEAIPPFKSAAVTLESLQREMAKAVKEERYEDAARIRDAIRALESGQKPEAGA